MASPSTPARYALKLSDLSDQYRSARALVGSSQSHDLRRGFNTTLILLTLVIWLISLSVLIYIARRVSKPIRDLTNGLTQLADGNFAARLARSQNDEIGLAHGSLQSHRRPNSNKAATAWST